MKLRGKITTVFVLVTVLVVGATGMLLLSKSSQLLDEQTDTMLCTSATLASDQMSELIGEYLIEAEATSKSLGYTELGQQIALGQNADSTILNAALGELAEVYGFVSGNVLNTAGISMLDGTDFSDREYVQRALAGEKNVSDVNVSKLTGKYGFSVAAPIELNGRICGVIYYRMETDFINEIISKIDITENSYAFLIDGDGNVIAHPNTDYIMNYNVFTGEDHLLTAIESQIKSGNSGVAECDFSTGEVCVSYAPIGNTNGWTLLIACPTSDVQEGLNQIVKWAIAIMLIACLVVVIISGMFGSKISRAAGNIVSSLGRMAEGDFSEKLPENIIGKDELATLGRSTKSILETLNSIVGDTNMVLNGLANYDLTVPDMKEYSGDFNQISVSVNAIKAILTELIREVNDAASSVNIGSGELSDAADALAGGTMEQANSIDQVLNNINNIADGIKSNAQNEQVVDDKLKNLDRLIQKGNDEMTTLLDVVKDVENMSTDIKKIVNTIDSIAFQTNILALNASVEAARAGENGRGFAVVADEVGNLAAKSAQASQQTSEMIEKCIAGIEKALKSAESTFDVLSNIVSDSAEIAGAFEMIAEDTAEQSVKSEDIRTEVKNIAAVVQTNTATAQQTSAATVELSGQAERLSALIGRFRLEGQTVTEVPDEEQPL